VIVVASNPAGEDAMGAKGLPIRTDVPAAELRRLARRERNRAAAARMQAVAGALEGLSRAEAARLAGGGGAGGRGGARAGHRRGGGGAVGGGGARRAEGGGVAGRGRQALRDAVVRYNAEGVAGLYSRPGPGRRARPTEEQPAAPRRPGRGGPDGGGAGRGSPRGSGQRCADWCWMGRRWRPRV